MSKSSLLAQSKVNLKEGNQVFLRVESLRPKIILKPLTGKELEYLGQKRDITYLLKKPSFWRLTKAIYQSEPKLRSVLRIIFNPKKIMEEIFWESIKKILLYIGQNASSKSSEYFHFINAVNNHAEGLYLQLPCFYSIRDIEIYFELKKGSTPRDKKYIIHIYLELSVIGPINITVEEDKEIEITFRVKKKDTQAMLKEHLEFFKETLQTKFFLKHIHMDCITMPHEYWKKRFHFNIINHQKENFVDLVV